MLLKQKALILKQFIYKGMKYIIALGKIAKDVNLRVRLR